MAPYIHHVPGRLRVRSAALKRNEAKAEAVRCLLEASDGIVSVKVAPLTGSITIHYDPQVTTDNAVLDTLRGCGCVPSAAEVEPEPVRARPDMNMKKTAMRIGKTVGETAVRFFVEKALERVAVAAVAAII